MKTVYRLSLLALLVLKAQGGYTQTVNDYLNAYLGANKEGYLQPLADMTIAGFNTGLQPSARIDDRFYIRLNLTAMGSMPMTSQKTFMATTEAPFSPQQTVSAPTIVGERKPVSVQGANNFTYVFPSGFGLKRLLWAVPQLTIGGIKGTEVSLRMLPYDFGGDFGKLQILGLSFRHDVGQYFLKKSPIVLNVGYAYNQSDIGKYIALQSHYAYVQAGVGGKRAGIFAWAGYQTGTFDVSYSYIENTQSKPVTANLKTKQPFLGGIGTHLQLGLFSLGAGVGGPVPLTGYGTLGFRFISPKKTKS
ncbi:MAG: hypothetical protein LH609_05280 [Rudanella sp.]|nr:hypothetical protein [Rudanella sp.]